MKISHNDMLFYSDVWSAKANEVAMTSYSLVMSGVLKLMIFFFHLFNFSEKYMQYEVITESLLI